MEMGEIEGAMSGLSIAVSGVFTVIGASVFVQFIYKYRGFERNPDIFQSSMSFSSIAPEYASISYSYSIAMVRNVTL